MATIHPYTNAECAGIVMDLRELKGLEIAARTKVVWADGAWQVPSQSGNGKYRVSLHPVISCPCEDFQLSQKPCKHIHAARFVLERADGGESPILDTERVPKRPTYKQNWKAYNLAQTTEKHRLQELLADLCRGYPEPPYKGNGRRPAPIADAIFACAFKVYSTFSSRRFGSDLADAHAKGYLSRPMHPNTINKHLEDAELTPILKALVERSSLPLRAVETDFAVDSSGFSANRFDKWFDEKYGVHRTEHSWVKAHVLCGTKTNVIAAAEVLDKNSADSPQFAPLVNAAARHFTINELSADKAYLSNDNLALVEALGGTAFIPFKVNSVGDSGGLWQRMFHFFNFKRDEFLAHYHKRSNVESVFSSVKAKFRDSVRAKSDVAMKNEVYCKLLCHNICCVIQEQCELGIEAEFWQNERQPEESPDVLKMTRPG
jgi:transposase